MPTDLKAVFFDAGETLLAPHPSHHELFAMVLAEHGYDVAPETVQEVFAGMAPTFVAVMDNMAVKAWSVSREASLEFWGRIYGKLSTGWVSPIRTGLYSRRSTGGSPATTPTGSSPSAYPRYGR